MRPAASLLRNRNRCLLTIVVLFILSRILYARLGVTFDSAPRLFYWQIIDPVLLRNAPWQSLFYLRNQLPGLNLLIAIVVQIYPDHPARIFQPIYMAMGLTLAVCLFLLLDRLQIGRPLAFLIAVVCTINPITALYENWLFYEYPIAVLFTVAALFLHRYATSHARTDGLIFFAALAFIGLFRVIYHWAWSLAIAALILCALPACRRRTVLCASGPFVLLLAFYVKSLLLFGLWTPGSDVYGSIAFTTLARGNLTRFELARLATRGVISRVLVYDLNDVDKISEFIPPPPPTGIPILDNRLKSTGVASLDSLWMAAVCRQMRRDGLKLLNYRPVGALTSIRDNIGRYFLPADIGWPFDGRTDTNKRVLAPVLSDYDLVVTGTIPGHQFAWLSFVTIPLLLLFGFLQSARWLRGSLLSRASDLPPGDAKGLTIVFAFANIAYLTVVIVFYDFTDQNRIIFEVFPLYALLLGCSLDSARRRLGRTNLRLAAASISPAEPLPPDNYKKSAHRPNPSISAKSEH